MTDAAALDALLPQLQCGRCGYGACAPYARALADGTAAPDRCGPGGDEVAHALAAALGVPALPSDPACGEPIPPQLAWIDPARCIGCARCLPACPVDAIVGARQYLHGVVDAQCTGCALCLPACPVDCIHLHPLPEAERTLARRAARGRVAAQRYAARTRRLGGVGPAPASAAPGRSPDLEEALARARRILADMHGGA
jgi:Na+-translocating ferredoxin:NAD+ oxidoreductase subunit B